LPALQRIPPSIKMVKLTKPKTFQAYLDNCHRRYSCVHCRAHLANHDDLISKSFQGSQGRAYLFEAVLNLIPHPYPGVLAKVTPLHSSSSSHISDVFPLFVLGQEQAYENSQKYKEGKYIIELTHMIKDNGWD
uniref:Yippee domain-containing protein n=1 Tax=Latimeria chalumnae TaxID=7897 RepID=H3A460_LATCH